MMTKKILITGGTGGIGCEITRSLIAAGHTVIIWSRDEEKFLGYKKNLGSKGKNLFFRKVDVSKEDEVRAASKDIGEIDILINSAAVLWPTQSFMDSKIDELRRSIDISMWGTIYTCYYLLPQLRLAKRGKIINFSGGGGANGRKDHMAYSLSKTALIRFTENLAIENPEVDVNIIAPGAHKTGMWQDEKCESAPEKWGSMEDLINFFNFLVSDQSDGITGKFINYRDDWRSDEFIKKIKEDTDFLTLRRIDDFQFTKIIKSND